MEFDLDELKTIRLTIAFIQKNIVIEDNEVPSLIELRNFSKKVLEEMEKSDYNAMKAPLEKNKDLIRLLKVLFKVTPPNYKYYEILSKIELNMETAMALNKAYKEAVK